MLGPELTKHTGPVHEIMHEGVDGIVLHGSAGARIGRALCLASGDADGLRAPKLQHAVQDGEGNRHLSRSTQVSARAQRLADHWFAVPSDEMVLVVDPRRAAPLSGPVETGCCERATIPS